MKRLVFRCLSILALLAVVTFGAVPGSAKRLKASPSWTFEGCFTYFASGPCLDVFRDSSGTLWVCKACGTTNNPNPSKCQILSGSGFWCS